MLTYANRAVLAMATAILAPAAAAISLAGTAGAEASEPAIQDKAARATARRRYEPTWESLARPKTSEP